MDLTIAVSCRELLSLRVYVVFPGIVYSTISICTDQQLLRFGYEMSLKDQSVKDLVPALSAFVIGREC